MTVTDQDFPKVALMVVTDGRWDYLADTMRSFEQQCDFPFAETHIVYDNPRRGLAGNIQRGWDRLGHDIEYVFHLEDDFTFPQRVPIREMISALRAYPSLAQVALKRQPWSPEEQMVGNMLLRIPTLEQYDNLCVHSNLFTFNPCLYPREITRYGAGLEAEVTQKLLADGWQFAYYGGKHDPPRCIHIGHRRSEGYRW